MILWPGIDPDRVKFKRSVRIVRQVFVADLAARNDPSGSPAGSEIPGWTVGKMGGPNRHLEGALSGRADAGWQVLSESGGYDPDALLVEDRVMCLQRHFSEKYWGRVYSASFGTAVDAGQITRKLGSP